MSFDDVIASLQKRFGQEAIMRVGDSPAGVKTISSGSLTLDMALGGGLPIGRVIEVYGPESSGKTTLCLHVIAEAQKLGGNCAFIDMEHALDIYYAKALGVDIANLAVAQPDNGEMALELVEGLVRSGDVSVIVIDSVAALVPIRELEGDMGDAVMGAQARLMSQALRKISGVVSKTGTTVIFTNQIRNKIGGYGNPETTTGGNALKFYASVRLDIRRILAIKEKDAVIGNRTRVKVVKNKVAPPFKTAEFDIFFGKGIYKPGEIVDIGVLAGVLEKKGSFYSYGDTKWHGKNAVTSALEADPVLMDEIEKKIKEQKVDLLSVSGDEDDV